MADLLGKLWDDVVAGPQPDRGLGKLRKHTDDVKDVQQGEGSKYERSLSMPNGQGASGASTPITPSTPTSARKENVWRSVFNPGSNLATKTIGAEVFDKPLQPNSPTVYDWLYSGNTRSKHR